MALKTFVKVGQISNLSDARYCSGMGVDQLGFSVNSTSDDYVSAEIFQEIIGWISGPDIVGEFGNMDASDIKDLLRSYQVNVVEYADLNQTEALSHLNKRLQYRCEILTPYDAEQLSAKLSYLDELVERVIFHCANPDLFAAIEEFVLFKHGSVPILKNFDINDKELMLDGFDGIELTGSEEERPGFKDYGMVMDVLERLEIDD